MKIMNIKYEENITEVNWRMFDTWSTKSYCLQTDLDRDITEHNELDDLRRMTYCQGLKQNLLLIFSLHGQCWGGY